MNVGTITIPDRFIPLLKFFRLTGPTAAGISGGRTSGLMHMMTLAANQDQLHWYLPCFANTGKEEERTLIFLKNMEEATQFPLHWLEFEKPVEFGAPPRFARTRQVDFQTAHRGMQIWYDFLGTLAEYRMKEKGEGPTAPAAMMRLCTAYMKLKTIHRFVRERWDDYDYGVGLRADEPKRVKSLKGQERRDDVTFVVPLFTAGLVKQDIFSFWAEQPFDLNLPEYLGNCTMCLAGDTEVVTSNGIYPIRELAGKEPELLVPKKINTQHVTGMLSEVGHFAKAPVRSFGVQPVWRVTLAGHGRSEKVVYATAEHRWFLTNRKSCHTVPKEAVITTQLKKGDRLRNLFRCQMGEDRGAVSKLGALHGFTFGDGTKPSGDRPGSINIFEGKDEVFLPAFEMLFGSGRWEKRSDYAKGFWHFYGLPRSWKTEYPSLQESRPYLIGWLSGYFAADGCVSEDGNCILSSAFPEHLCFARSVCAVLGVGYSPLTHQDRHVVLPTGKEMDHRIYSININRHHVPVDFFWLPHHRQRVQENADKAVRKYHWTVKSIEKTDRVEEVFCATVDGVGAFGLADSIMTGNCFLKDEPDISTVMNETAGEAEEWIALQDVFGDFRRGHTNMRTIWAETRWRMDVIRPAVERYDYVPCPPGFACEPGWLERMRWEAEESYQRRLIRWEEDILDGTSSATAPKPKPIAKLSWTDRQWAEYRWKLLVRQEEDRRKNGSTPFVCACESAQIAGLEEE